MTIHRSLLALAVVAGFAAIPQAFSQAAFAQGWEHGQGHGFAEILNGVDLSSAQKQQIHQLMKTAHTQNAPTMAQIRTLRSQIESTMFSTGDVTAAQLTPMQQQVETLQQQLDASRIQTALAIRNVLTSAQLARASSMQAQLSSLHQQEHAIVAPAAAAE